MLYEHYTISSWKAVWRGMVLFRFVPLYIQCIRTNSLKTFISNTSASSLVDNFHIRTGVFGPIKCQKCIQFTNRVGMKPGTKQMGWNAATLCRILCHVQLGLLVHVSSKNRIRHHIPRRDPQCQHHQNDLWMSQIQILMVKMAKMQVPLVPDKNVAGKKMLHGDLKYLQKITRNRLS